MSRASLIVRRLIGSAAIAALTITGCTSARRPSTPDVGQPTDGTRWAAPVPPPASVAGPYPMGRRVLLPEAEADAAVLAYRQPVAAPLRSGAGLEWSAARVRVCVIRAEPRGSAVRRAPWVLLYPDGTTVDPAVGADGGFARLESPLFTDRLVPAGGCVQGWIRFEVPTGRRPQVVSYSLAESRRPLHWRVG